MTQKTILAVAALSLAALGCEKGACYYTCCADPEDEHCAATCVDGTKTAEACAVDAQGSCEASGGTLGQVEWDEISDLYCDSCSDFACAPQWWTEERLADGYDGNDSDSDSDSGDEDGGDTASDAGT